MLLQGYLVGEQLERGGAVVRGVADVVLRPDQVLHHQHEEDKEAEEVGPDVDRLVVEAEDAAEAVPVTQPPPVVELETKVHNHGEGPYYDLLLVERGYYHLHI